MTIKTHVSAEIKTMMNKSNTFNDFVFDSINRHLSCDWGDVSDDNKSTNDKNFFQALSSYKGPGGLKILLKQDGIYLTVLCQKDE